MKNFGSHVSLKGKEMFLGSIKETISYNADALMIYTGAPQNTRRKPITEFCLEEAYSLMEKNNISMKNVVVHAPYIVNLGNPSIEKYEFAVNFLTQEIKRCAEIGVSQMVLHPGAHVKQSAEVAIKRIAKGINQIIENTKNLNVLIALETMSGKGTEVGRNFDEIANIIELIEHKERISVCFDTCHVHDSGYDIVNDFNNVLIEFDKKIGLDKITVLHVNDSKNVIGTSKDRHENIGFGEIGFSALYNIINHAVFEDIPKILETPYITKNDDSKQRIYPPYQYELEMFRNNKFDSDLIQKIRQLNNE